MSLFGKPKGSEVTIEVEGMTCGHCAMRVETAIGSCGGVLRARVDLSKKIAVVSYDPASADTSEFVRKIEETGYKAKLLQ